MHYVIVPGINGSDQDHWQTRWQEAWGSSASRIGPSSWDEPELEDWLRALDRAAAPHQASDLILIAHSLGCLAVASWLRSREGGARAAFLVAPPDPDGPNFPAVAAGFRTSGLGPLAQPALVISSDDDPYCAPHAARRLASEWRAGHVGVGKLGHLNSASGLGAWEAGKALLTGFTTGLG